MGCLLTITGCFLLLAIEYMPDMASRYVTFSELQALTERLTDACLPTWILVLDVHVLLELWINHE